MDSLTNPRFSTRVFLGFGLVLALLLFTAVFGVYGLTEAETIFKQYRGLARQTNADGRIQANMLMTRIFAKSFVIDPSDENVRGVEERAKKTIQMIEGARGLAKNPTYLAALD